MKAQKHQFFTIGDTIYISVVSPITIDNYNERCVECGSDKTSHVADVIQYGIFMDRVTSVFRCNKCGHTYHFTYEAMARDSETYLILDGERERGEA